MEHARSNTIARTGETYQDENNLIFACLGMLALISVYVIILYRVKWSGTCCFVHRENSNIHHQDPVLTRVMRSMGKTTPPPPYEHPPSYAVAVSIENEDIKSQK